MLKKTIREFTDQEKKEFQSRLPSTYKKFEEIFLLFGGIYLVILLCFLGLDYFCHFSSTIQLIFVILNIPLTLLIIGQLRNKYGSKQPKIVEDKIEVYHVMTSRAIRREEYEDLGDSFYIDVVVDGQNKVLYLCGQYLYELVDDKKFPNTEFEVLRKVGEPDVFDIKVMGTYFEPEKTLPSFDKKTIQNGPIPFDLDILDLSLDQI